MDEHPTRRIDSQVATGEVQIAKTKGSIPPNGFLFKLVPLEVNIRKDRRITEFESNFENGERQIGLL